MKWRHKYRQQRHGHWVRVTSPTVGCNSKRFIKINLSLFYQIQVIYTGVSLFIRNCSTAQESQVIKAHSMKVPGTADLNPRDRDEKQDDQDSKKPLPVLFSKTNKGYLRPFNFQLNSPLLTRSRIAPGAKGGYYKALASSNRAFSSSVCGIKFNPCGRDLPSRST